MWGVEFRRVPSRFFFFFFFLKITIHSFIVQKTKNGLLAFNSKGETKDEGAQLVNVQGGVQLLLEKDPPRT